MTGSEWQARRERGAGRSGVGEVSSLSPSECNQTDNQTEGETRDGEARRPNVLRLR